MKFTRIPTDTFSNLQLNAGILLGGENGFDPATGQVIASNILGATTGGITVSCIPSYIDFGEDVDNCPKNMKELKKIVNWDCKITGTFITISASATKLLLGAADINSFDGVNITPRNELSSSDFTDVWFVGDYSDHNGSSNGGFVAIHLMNALNSGGFSLKTEDKQKGQFSFEFTGHVSIDTQDIVPMEFYVKVGTAESTYTPTEEEPEETEPNGNEEPGENEPNGNEEQGGNEQNGNEQQNGG